MSNSAALTLASTHPAAAATWAVGNAAAGVADYGAARAAYSAALEEVCGGGACLVPPPPASPLLPLKPPPPTLPLPAAHLLRQPPRHLPPVQARLPPHRGGHGRPGQVGAGAVPHSSFSAGVLPTWWAGSDVCMAGLDESRGHTLQGLLSLCAVRERLDALGSVPLQLGWCPAGSGAGFASFGSHAAAGSASCGSQLARPAL